MSGSNQNDVTPENCEEVLRVLEAAPLVDQEMFS